MKGINLGKKAERLEDEIFIRQYRLGDDSSIEKLIGRWQKRLYHYVVSLIYDNSAVWDILQEIWLSVIKTLKSQKRIENFPTWIYGVARNQTFFYLRKNRLLPKTYDEGECKSEITKESLIEMLELKENVHLVKEALSELSLSHREVLTLFYLQDLSLREIAQVTNISSGTLRSRLHYGRIHLKKILLQKGYNHE